MSSRIQINVGDTRAPGQATVYDTIADLEGSAGTAGRNLAFVAGYYSAGDGGGGTFIWDSDQSVTNADGGTIISGGGSIGCWIRQYDTEINVKWFGAKGDNTTDDQPAIQAAIETAERNGKNVFIPAGRYSIQSELVRSVDPAITIRGEGRNDALPQFGTTMYQDYNGGNLFRFEGAGVTKTFYSTFRDMLMSQRNEYPTAGDMIYLPRGATYLEIKNISFLLKNPAARWLYSEVENAMGNLENIQGRMAAGASVPAIEINSSGNLNTFGITMRNHFIFSNLTATAPIYYLEGTEESFSLSFDNIILETPNGGGIWTKSIRKVTYRGVVSADMEFQEPLRATILVDTNAGELEPDGHSFYECTLAQGTESVPDIEMSSGPGQGPPAIVNSRIGFVKQLNAYPILLGNKVYNEVSGAKTPVWLRTDGKIQGLRTISSTGTASNNLRGSATISDTSTSVTVTFDTAESDDSYFVTATATAESGTPETGSARHKVTNKIAAGFDIEVETAPGAGNSVTFDWILVR